MTAETIHTCSYSCERPGCIRAQRDELVARLTALAAEGVQAEAPSGAVNVVGMPEFDGLLDHIYEHGTAAEGVIERANAFARAVLAQYAPQQHAVVDEAMVERACKASLDEIWPDTYEEADDLRAMIRRILSAALATKHQEPTT